MKRLLPGLSVALVAIIWGTTFLVIKHSLQTTNPIAIVTYRFWLASIMLAFITFFTSSPLNKHWKEGIILGFIMFSQLILMAIGLQYTSAANASFLNGVFLIFVPMFGFLLFKRMPLRKEIISFTVSLIGIWVITGGMKSFNKGDLLILLNAACNGLFIVLVNKFVKNHINPISLVFQESIVITLLGLTCMFLFRIPYPVYDLSTYYTIGYLAAFATVIGFVIFFTAQKYMQTSTSSIIQSLQLVFGAMFAWTLGNEPFHHIQLLGGLIILLSILILELPNNHILLNFEMQFKKKRYFPSFPLFQKKRTILD